MPEQPPPLQPPKVEPAAGAAVSVTAVPLAKLAAQVGPQLMPAGLLVTVPAPAPALETVSTRAGVNVAVTVVAAESVTVQAPVPEQPPPLQPVKVEPAAEVAVRVTAVPLVKLAEQVAPQLIPAGALVTVPLPVPALLTVSVNVWSVNVAVTVVAAESVTVQAPVPEQPPPVQPVKVEPAAAVAVSVTAVPLVKLAEQVAPQLMPAGALVTVPLPVPAGGTVRVEVCTVKVAVTVVAAESVTAHVPAPEQLPPLQPVKVEPAAGVAVSVTAVPLVKLAEQVAPQVIPAGALVTVPLPVPAGVTVRVEVCTVKVAVTVVPAESVTTHVPAPEQPPPLQPVKVEPAAGVAVSVTAVPLAKLAVQVAPQLIPTGALVTVPLPVPALLTVSAKVGRAKVAVTVVAALRVTVQVPVPEHPPPLQPVKVEPAAGVAVSVTAVPLAKLTEQVAPQLIPTGELVTVPLPVPAGVTVRVKLCRVKVAVTVVAAETVTTHDPVPEQPPPLQPVKVEPAAGVAVNVTAVPLAKLAEQLAPQLIPAGELVTVPLPVPALLTVSAKLGRLKVAVTVVAAESVTVQAPVPEQPPPVQPVKVEPAAAVAVSVTAVPLAKLAEQVAPQLIPAGELVTVPLPVPALETVRVKVCGVKVAVTVVAAEHLTVQAPVPEQPPPLQPLKVEPAAGTAVSVTAVPLVKLAAQVAPQLMPAGLLVTVPAPAPALETVSTRAGVKVAVTVVAAESVTVQAPGPEQPPPLQPVKVEPAAGTAVSVTAVPFVKLAAQVAPQLIPAGLLVTVPVPVPALETVRAKVGVKVTVKMSVAVLPAASRAVTVSTFDPGGRTIPLAVQLVVPVAVPLPPALFVHVTWVTPTLSDAVPPSVRGVVLVLKVGLEVGEVTVSVGGVASAPVPVTIRERVSPSAVKLAFVVAVAGVVGVKRTVTVWVAPSPTRLNGLPETMLKGAETAAVPETVPPIVFCTVKV